MTKVEKVAEVFFYSIEIWKKNANGNDVIKRKKNGKERGYCLSDVLKQEFKMSFLISTVTSLLDSFFFLAVLGLCCCRGFSLISASGSCSLVVVHGLLIVVASLAAEHSPVRHMGSVVPASGL